MHSSKLLLLVPLVLAACGGSGEVADDGSADDTTRSGDTVVIESADGFASIEIAPSSLPEGTSIDDVRITAAVDESGVPGLPVVAARMEPHGIVLTQPATVTMRLPEPIEGSVVTIHQSGDYVQFVESVFVDDGRTSSISTDVSSFSRLLNYDYALTAAAALTPKHPEVNTSQTAIATISPSKLPATFLLWSGSGSDATLRRYTMSPPTNVEIDFADFEWRPDDGRLEYGDDFESSWVDPGARPDKWSKLGANLVSAPVASTCTEARDWVSALYGVVEFDLRLVEAGESEAADLAAASLMLGPPESGTPVEDDEANEWRQLADLEAGDSVEATAWIFEKQSVTCTQPGLATTTTSTTTTIPVGTSSTSTSTTTTTEPPPTDSALNDFIDSMVPLLPTDGGKLGEDGGFVESTPNFSPFDIEMFAGIGPNDHVVFYIEGPTEIVTEMAIEFDAVGPDGFTVVAETGYLGNGGPYPPWALTAPAGSLIRLDESPIPSDPLPERVFGIVTTAITYAEHLRISSWLYAGFDKNVYCYGHYEFLLRDLDSRLNRVPSLGEFPESGDSEAASIVWGVPEVP